MIPGFEHFDHTADMGLRICSQDLPGLLLPAADALYAAIGELVPGGNQRRVKLSFTGDDAAVLLRDYLAELLHLFECQSRILTSLDDVTFDQRQLSATIILADVDFDHSDLRREVKAITYHELSINPTPGGVEATVIVDI